MDKREIISTGSVLQKAVASQEPPANIVNILRHLQKDVRPTEEILRATGIGKIVNKIKGNKNPEVARLAGEMVSKWRHTVNEQKLANGGSPAAATPNGATRANGTPSPAPAPKPAPNSTTDPNKRSWKEDKVDRANLTKDTARNNCIGLIYDGLCVGSTASKEQILALAKQVEAAALDLPEAKGDSASSVYREKIRSLYQNLKNKSNPQLRVRILSGEVTPGRFVVMTYEELKSREQREEDRKIEKENMDKAMVAQEEKSVSTSLQCGKCGQKRVSYNQAQTRSADEPMTTFCECVNCGNRWKFS